jgi:hypothetical protein
VYFDVFWYIFPRFGTLYQEKSGNPAQRILLSHSFETVGLIRKMKTLLSLVASKSGLAICNSGAGLPDAFFSNQKSKFGQILEGLRMEKVDIF